MILSLEIFKSLYESLWKCLRPTWKIRKLNVLASLNEVVTFLLTYLLNVCENLPQDGKIIKEKKEEKFNTCLVRFDV
jgi:hypothetical protein